MDRTLKFIFIIIIFSHFKLFANCSQIDTKIANLNKYLTLFKDCLIHIINYDGIDFNEFEYPAMSSRYLFNLTNGKYQKVNIYKSNDSIVGNNIKKINYKSPCDVHLYLYPLVTNNHTNKGFVPTLVPREYWMGWKTFYTSYTRRPEIDSRNLYHILVTNTNSYNFEWNKVMSEIALEFPISDFLIFQTAISKKYSNAIFEILVECKPCKTYTRTFHRLESQGLIFNRSHLNEILEQRNKIGYGKGWITFQSAEFTSNQVVRSLNSVLRSFQNGVVPFRKFKNMKNENYFSSELVNFALVVPNVTLLKADTLGTDCNAENAVIVNEIGIEIKAVFDGSCSTPQVEFGKIEGLTFVQENDQFTFLACGQVQISKLSFKGFLSPFDNYTWILITVFYFGFSFFYSIVIFRKFSFYIIFHSIISGFDMLIEQEDKKSQNLNKFNCMYWICGTLMLISIVLSNAYKGENISAITAPYSPRPHENFSQLLNYKYEIFSLLSENKKSQLYLRASSNKLFNRSEDHEDILSKTEFGILLENNLNEKSQDLINKITYHSFEYENVKWGRFNFSFHSFLSNCSNIALTGWSTKLQLLSKQIHLNRIKVKDGHISMGKETLFQRTTGWRIRKWTNPHIFMRLAALHESGIMNQWLAFDQLVQVSNFKTKNDTVNAQDLGPQPLALSGNVVSIIIILMFGIFCASICFVSESMSRIVNLVIGGS